MGIHLNHQFNRLKVKQFKIVTLQWFEILLLQLIFFFFFFAEKSQINPIIITIECFLLWLNPTVTNTQMNFNLGECKFKLGMPKINPKTLIFNQNKCGKKKTEIKEKGAWREWKGVGETSQHGLVESEGGFPPSIFGSVDALHALGNFR